MRIRDAWHSWLPCALLSLCAAEGAYAQRWEPDASDEVSVELHARLASEAAANIARLQAEGQLPPAVPRRYGAMAWPLGPVPGAGSDRYAITAFVDHDAQLLAVHDYTCGGRARDNHFGTDIALYPFPWLLMESGAVNVRAADAGVLVGREDGHGDRSCSTDVADTPNYVTIRHADGTISYYLHLMNGSVTNKPIGAAIANGETIGIVGSSGRSTAPHLHFEVRADASEGAEVIDPFRGSCNDVPSGWAFQRPYEQAFLISVSTHSQDAEYETCNATTGTATAAEIAHFSDDFQPGESVRLGYAKRDVDAGDVTHVRVMDADRAVKLDLEHVEFVPPRGIGGPPYLAVTDFLPFTLPSDAPHGLWTLEVTNGGRTLSHPFRVGGTTTAIGDMKGLVGAWYDPATSGQGFDLHWINGTTALIFFYGHHDDGRNFFLLGQRDAPWDFGQEISFPMYETRGGRWSALDPAAITRPAWGALRITFVACALEAAELDGIDGAQVLNLERLGRTVGLGCD